MDEKTELWVICQGLSLPLPRFPKFYLGETIEGTGRGGNWMGQGQGNREDGVRPGSQGLRGFPWSPSLCGVPRCREGGMARNRDVVLPESWRNFSITVVNWRQ